MGENLKDAWYSICEAHNRSTHKQSTTLLHNFLWVSLIRIDFCLILSPEGISFNAMGNLVGSPPITINEMVLTLEHVMQRLDAIENNMPTIEHIDNLDKKIHNHATQFG